MGCIPSKSLLNNSMLYHQAEHDFANRGINIEGLSFDLDKMLGAKEKSVSTLTGGIEMLFKANGECERRGRGVVLRHEGLSAGMCRCCLVVLHGRGVSLLTRLALPAAR